METACLVLFEGNTQICKKKKKNKKSVQTTSCGFGQKNTFWDVVID